MFRIPHRQRSDGRRKKTSTFALTFPCLEALSAITTVRRRSDRSRSPRMADAEPDRPSPRWTSPLPCSPENSGKSTRYARRFRKAEAALGHGRWLRKDTPALTSQSGQPRFRLRRYFRPSPSRRRFRLPDAIQRVFPGSRTPFCIAHRGGSGGLFRPVGESFPPSRQSQGAP